MGADRGILIKTEGWLAVAMPMRAVALKEQPGLALFGK